MKSKKKKKLPESVPSKRNKLIIYLLLLVIVPSVLYLRIVSFGLSEFDDSSIINNIVNREGSKINLIDAFTHGATMSNNMDTYYRPMQILSLMIDAEISGVQPWMYHLSNLILHILTVIVLFFFLNKTGIKQEISFLLSLFFSVNPMFTNAVAWIPARGDLLLCLFSLLSFLTFLEYYKTAKKFYLIVHAIVIGGAVFSKETSVLLPFLLLFYLYIVIREKLLIKKIAPVLLIWIISFGLFFYMRSQIITGSLPSNIFGIVPFFNNLSVIPIAFGRFFIPYNLSPMPFFESTSLIIGAILIIIFLFLIVKIIPDQRRTVIWGGAWFLAFSIPPMFLRSIFANIGYEYFDYRAYLPIIGILLIAGLIIQEWTSKNHFKKVLRYSIPMILVYTAITYNYSPVFNDSISFFSSAINANPKNAMALGERGVAYSKEGKIDKALADYDNSIKVWPAYPTPYFNKGLHYYYSNDNNKAEYYYSLALKYDTINPDVSLLKARAYINLSKEKLILHKYDEALTLLKEGISKYPDNGRMHNNLGLAYYYKTNFDSALYEYNKALGIENNSYEYYNNRGIAKNHNNDIRGALNDFDKAIELKPDFLDALGNRGLAKVKLNEYEEAILDLNKAIDINPNIGTAWYYRGLAYYRLNKIPESMNNLNIARNLGYKGKDYDNPDLRSQ